MIVIQRAYETRCYLEFLQKEHDTKIVHFILLFDKEFTQKEAMILGIFSKYFYNQANQQEAYYSLKKDLVEQLNYDKNIITDKDYDTVSKHKVDKIDTTLKMLEDYETRIKECSYFRKKKTTGEFLFTSVYYSKEKNEFDYGTKIKEKYQVKEKDEVFNTMKKEMDK